MIDCLKKLLTHPALALAFRLYLGGLFIYAAMYKINYVGEFSNTIASYRLVPYWAVNGLAVVMPWTEIICGALLVLGVRVKSASAVITGLLSVFAVAILVNILRDSPISCGCFHTLEDPISWWTVLRDLTWIGMALHVFHFDRFLQTDQLFLGQLRRIES